MLKSLLLSTAALAAVLPVAAHAQDMAPESVVVTATRIPTPQEQIGSSVTLIDAGQIEARQQRSLPDILADVPGLNVVQSGGAGGQTSVFLRGANSSQTKILVDGIDMADPSTPNDTFDLGKLSAADIARVEVLRGPQSGLYGADAIGGVIAVITKAGDGPLAVTANAEGGSFDTFNQSATLSGSRDALHYRLTVAHDHAGDTPVTPPGLLLPGEKANGDYYDSVTVSTKLGYDLTDNFDLGFAGRYNNNLQRITTDASDPVTYAYYPSPTQTRIDMVQYDGRATAHLVLGRIDQTLGLAYSSNVTSDLDPNNGPLPSSGDRIKLDWQGNIALMDGETLVLGAESGRDAIHVPLSAGVTTNAGYVELQSVQGAFSASLSGRYDANSMFGDKLTWHFAPVYRVAASGTRLHASIGTGFKAPSLEDLFLSFPSFGFFANPNLKPETSTGYDIGLDQTLFGVTGGVTWFHDDIKNLIASNAFGTMDINIGRARTQGVEAYLAWKPLETLTLRADYTDTEAEDAATHVALVRRPRNKASVNALWQALPVLSLDASLLYVGSWRDNGRESFASLRAPGYTTTDIAVNYAVTDMFSLYGRADNLFDKTYQDPSGFLRPGRGLYAGVKAAF